MSDALKTRDLLKKQQMKRTTLGPSELINSESTANKEIVSTADSMANDLKILRNLMQKEKELDKQLRDMESHKSSHRGYEIRKSIGESQLKRNSQH